MINMNTGNQNTNRMQLLISILNEAAEAYYDKDTEIMSNLEYDKLYDELSALEEETGVILSGSPTQRVGYMVSSELPKESFKTPLLSLDKTKSVEELKDWLGDKEGMLSWKLDGLTVALSYENGELTKAVTRGDGYTGEVITNNARVFDNLPLKISHKSPLHLRGEAVIRYSDFKKINEAIEDIDAKYKNPRNLSSGSVRQLNNEITAKRKVRFYAFSLADAPEFDNKNSRIREMEFLREQGFETVDFFGVTKDTIEDRIKWFAEEAPKSDLPADGLVLGYDDIEYGKSLGTTSKFPRDSIAFKWEDETKETVLREIEWSTSRTGLINPIAIFGSVEIEGTTVSRASVHNISILEELELGIGDTITVYKANMIIPQIADNLTRSANMVIPTTCPVCGAEAIIKDDNGVKVLYCTNPNCVARQIKIYSHFVSRKALDVEGLSESTLEKFIGMGFIHEFADIFNLAEHKDEIIEMEGFGEKSYNNLVSAIDDARDTTPVRLLYSLGIPTIGLENAKLIARAYDNQWGKMVSANEEDLTSINGIGDVMAKTYVSYFAEEKNQELVANLLKELQLEEVSVPESGSALAGKVFVITGILNTYENRDALKSAIENQGGKVTGSVSEKTDYLINNDVNSNSSKNKKAKQLDIPIIDEDEINRMLKEL
jgi:DNA ligase (NAD+)